MAFNTKSISMASKVKKENFLREMQKELKKVNWTTREELILYTKMVLWSTLLFGLAIYGIDLFLRGGLGIVSTVFRFIFG